MTGCTHLLRWTSLSSSRQTCLHICLQTERSLHCLYRSRHQKLSPNHLHSHGKESHRSNSPSNLRHIYRLRCSLPRVPPNMISKTHQLVGTHQTTDCLRGRKASARCSHRIAWKSATLSHRRIEVRVRSSRPAPNQQSHHKELTVRRASRTASSNGSRSSLTGRRKWLLRRVVSWSGSRSCEKRPSSHTDFELAEVSNGHEGDACRRVQVGGGLHVPLLDGHFPGQVSMCPTSSAGTGLCGELDVDSATSLMGPVTVDCRSIAFLPLCFIDRKSVV